MSEIGRLLVIVGAGMLVLGAAIWLLARLGFRGLPGDVRIETDHVRIYIPIFTSFLLSALLTAGLWLWQWLKHK